MGVLGGVGYYQFESLEGAVLDIEYSRYLDAVKMLLDMAQRVFSQLPNIPRYDRFYFQTLVNRARRIEFYKPEPTQLAPRTYVFCREDQRLTVQLSESPVWFGKRSQICLGIDLETGEPLFHITPKIEGEGTLSPPITDSEYSDIGQPIFRGLLPIYLLKDQMMIIPICLNDAYSRYFASRRVESILTYVRRIESIVRLLFRIENSLDDSLKITDWLFDSELGHDLETMNNEQLKQLFDGSPMFRGTNLDRDRKKRKEALKQLSTVENNEERIRLLRQLWQSGVKSDLFSLGTLLFYSLFKLLPFKIENKNGGDRLIYSIHFHKYLERLDCERLKQLLKDLLKENNEERPTSAQVLERLSIVIAQLEEEDLFYLRYCQKVDQLTELAEKIFSQSSDFPPLTRTELVRENNKLSSRPPDSVWVNESSIVSHYSSEDFRYLLHFADEPVAGGYFSDILFGIEVRSGRSIVCKRAFDERSQRFLKREFDVLSRLVVGYSESIQECLLYSVKRLVCPLYPGRDYKRITNGRTPSIITVLTEIEPLLRTYMLNDVTHGDIKSKNLFVDNSDPNSNRLFFGDWSGGLFIEDIFEVSNAGLVKLFEGIPHTATYYPNEDRLTQKALLREILDNFEDGQSCKEKNDKIFQLWNHLRKCDIFCLAEVIFFALFKINPYNVKKVKKDEKEEKLILDYSRSSLSRLKELRCKDLENLLVDMLSPDINQRPLPEEAWGRFWFAKQIIMARHIENLYPHTRESL